MELLSLGKFCKRNILMWYLLLFYSNLISSSILLGLILVIHFVHYKSFYFIPDKEFINFHTFHTRSISYLVIPLMIVEASTSIIICFFYYGLLPLINLILVLSIWIVTFLLQVPCHNKLSSGKSETTIKKLIDTNTIRVYLWLFKTISILLIIL